MRYIIVVMEFFFFLLYAFGSLGLSISEGGSFLTIVTRNYFSVPIFKVA